MRKKSESSTWQWPKLSTISIYNQEPERIFSSNDRKFDLSDMLTGDLILGECKTAFIGIAIPGNPWEIWSEDLLMEIENRIRYQFEFENFEIEIERVSDESAPWYTHEFVWKLTFWQSC